MNAQDAIRATLATSSMVLDGYCADFTDAELLNRPGPGCNHLAWQLGHLIASECRLLDSICPGTAPQLPAGFAEQHGKDATQDDDPARFCTVQEYRALLEKVHGATLGALEKLSETDLDLPGPDFLAPMFPSVGHVLVLISTHGMMHAGQFVPVRRALGKPVVI